MSPGSAPRSSSFEPAARLGRLTPTDCAKPPDRSTRLIGVVAPLVLFNMDRAIFQGTPDGGILPYRPYCCLLAAVSVVCLLLWFRYRDREHWILTPLAGALLLGSVFALGIGLVLLPYSLIGLLAMGFGLLGLIPFWVSYIYLRAAVLAYWGARRRLGRGQTLGLALTAVLGISMGAIGVGSLAESFADEQIAILLGERPGEAARAESALAVLYVFPQVRITRLRAAAFAQFHELAAAGSERAESGQITQSFMRIAGRPMLFD